MFKFLKSLFRGINSIWAWIATLLKQTTISYCDIQTADSRTVLVANDGSLVSILRVEGVQMLIGKEEFERILDGLKQSLQTTLSHSGYLIQVFFSYNKDEIKKEITEIFTPAKGTAQRLGLNLDDLFNERVDYLAEFCACEEVYLALWTRLGTLTSEQNKRARSEKLKEIKKNKIPPFFQTQNILAAVPDLRESHDSFVRSVSSDFNNWGIITNILEVHEAVAAMRRSADPEFTDRNWRPLLPGDKITIKEYKEMHGEISDILWPSLARQVLPRDAENINLRTTRVGDRIYSTVFIDLFPKDVQSFVRLFSRTLQTQIPWRISFLIESNGLGAAGIRSAIASVLTVTSRQNRLISDSLKLLSYINLSGDDAVVRLRVSAATWAPEDDMRLLRSRASMLSRAIQGWGSCDVSEISGDSFEGVVSSMLAVSSKSVATPSIAPLSDVLTMLPLFRPASPWNHGAILFRSPDGKPWPYHPGSQFQTTWIDLFYARPGSGKSVLSNAINLAVCLSAGISRLPRIAVVDIGPSSSGLISLLKDALPANQKHLVAYHRLRMRADYAINPFDTQLGCRFPTPQERSFLVNFLTLLVTPVGAEKAYDGVADMSGLVVDELYKSLADEGNPNVYAAHGDENVDTALEEIGFVRDPTNNLVGSDGCFIYGGICASSLAGAKTCDAGVRRCRRHMPITRHH